MPTKLISSFFSRLFTASMIAILVFSALPAQPVYAAAAQLDAWTPQTFGPSGNNATINAGNITVSVVGANRLFIGAACIELTGPNTMDAFSMTLGGTTLVPIGDT